MIVAETLREFRYGHEPVSGRAFRNESETTSRFNGSRQGAALWWRAIHSAFRALHLQDSTFRRFKAQGAGLMKAQGAALGPTAVPSTSPSGQRC